MRKLISLIAASLCFAACSHAITAPTVPLSPPTKPPIGSSGSPIKHIVFIIQENRTFDNIFGGPNPFPGADAATSGKTHDGKTIALDEVNLESPFGLGDPNNFHFQWLAACNAPTEPPFIVGQPAPCKMNGFDRNAEQQQGYPKPPSIGYIYSYANRDEVAPYWFIAKHYAVGDRFFMGHNSESYTGHQYIFSSQSHGTVDPPVFPSSVPCGAVHDYCAYTPWGCDSPDGTLMYTINAQTGAFTGPPATPSPNAPSPCFGRNGGYPSIADLAQNHNVGWRLYAYSMCSGILGLDANWTVRYGGPQWPPESKMANCNSSYGLYSPLTSNTFHFRAPQYTFLADEATGGKPLTNVTWILPGAFTSDHPGVPGGDCGPTWVAKVINAIGKNKTDWASTVIFVLWDDWGGFYDHVPPYVVRDQTGPGFRVPLLVVSPYVRSGQVVHTNIEFATLNKFVETTFGLGSLRATDATSYLNNLDAFFNFNQTPQKFTPIPYPSYIKCNYLPDAAPPAVSAAAHSRWLRVVGADPD